MQKHDGWEIIKLLGKGGQSAVHLVRAPSRVDERQQCLNKIRKGLDEDDRQLLAKAIYSFARPDSVSELGALKIFEIAERDSTLPPHPGSENEAIQRLKKEIIVLNQKRPGLPKLLASNEDGHWIVTEYFPERTLECHASRYRGKAVPALRAFRSLVETVASLHRDAYIHRDIKPANVFIRKADQLVLGDFGIVYVPDLGERLTVTNERVGPRDYIPQWANIGERLENVEPNFDVYMLGKLLWCMIAGKLVLPREYYRKPQWNLTALFPKSEEMHLINSILDLCIVEEPGECLASAQELLDHVDRTLSTLERGAALLSQDGELHLPCRICGKGSYKDSRKLQLRALDEHNRDASPLYVRVLICNVCAHHQCFAPGYPDEAAKRGWEREPR